VRLQLAGSIDRMAMNGDEREAAFLIEAQCMEIIIRGDQPEPLAACFACRLRDCLDQQRAYTDSRLGASDRHDLAVLIFKSVGKQSHPVPFQDGDEAEQRLWMIDLAVSDDERIAPVFDENLPYLFAVFGGKPSHLQRKAFDGPVGIPVVGVDGLGLDVKVDAFAPLASLCMGGCVQKGL